MRPYLLALTLVLAPLGAQAVDLANGEQINRVCALCHGIYGQGTPGRLSPRLAGLRQEYMVKAIKEYRDGKRISPTMVTTSGLDGMSEEDINDVAAYLSQLKVPAYALIDVTQSQGDKEAGQEFYEDECKTCHREDGTGKPEKGVPPLNGQHSAYVYQTIRMFQWRKRVHDDDPEDDTFDELTEEDLLNLTAHLATLDDEDYKLAQAAPAKPVAVAAVQAKPAPKAGAPDKPGVLKITDITQTVAQMQLKPEVTPDDAVQAMLSKAAELNMKLVGQQYVSKELEARGQETPYLTILQFCDPEDAKTMVVHNPIFASYMPCRIAVVEDQEGKYWAMMLNLDMLINSALLPPEVTEIAIRVNETMLDIMLAGATGEF